MSDNLNILAYYLPQFHEMEINNKWWGKGFTEWDNVKKAKSLFEGHKQPRVPLDNNYYDLSDINVMKWQAQIAKEHGLYGFCFYHYWFDNEPVMDKPLRNFLNSDIDFHYCLSWANESWTNAWAKSESSVIMEQKYGDKSEWKKHFDFLLPFFKDERYIKEGNCPFIVIYRPYLCDVMCEMLEYWKELAIECGFNGIKIASQRFEEPESFRNIYDYLDYHISYESRMITKKDADESVIKKVRKGLHDIILKIFNIDISIKQNLTGPLKFDYDEAWTTIINKVSKDEKDIAGAFVNWDNTPRHSKRGTVYWNVSPEKFEFYMKKQIVNVKNNYNTPYIFLFAWNEWGEGGIMEPDMDNGYAYLDALKRALET